MSSVDETINNFIAVAERFHGVREGTPQHSIIIALYNSSKPKDEHEMSLSEPWCASFVGAVSGGCGLQNIVPVSSSCDRMSKALIKSGAFVVSVPKPGDIAFFDWNGDGIFDDHVGIVTHVDSRTVTTIEGNRSDMVAYRQFFPESTPVRFYRPNWSGEVVQPTEPVSWNRYRDFYSELTWDEKSEIKTFPTLRIGSKGVYVKILQDFIGVTTDGDFGDMTFSNLKIYQGSKQLEVDGICGRQTWSSFFA